MTSLSPQVSKNRPSPNKCFSLFQRGVVRCWLPSAPTTRLFFVFLRLLWQNNLWWQPGWTLIKLLFNALKQFSTWLNLALSNRSAVSWSSRSSSLNTFSVVTSHSGSVFLLEISTPIYLFTTGSEILEDHQQVWRRCHAKSQRWTDELVWDRDRPKKGKKSWTLKKVKVVHLFSLLVTFRVATDHNKTF